MRTTIQEAPVRVVIHRIDEDDLAEMRHQYPFSVRQCFHCKKCLEVGELTVRIETPSVTHIYHELCFRQSKGLIHRPKAPFSPRVEGSLGSKF